MTGYVGVLLEDPELRAMTAAAMDEGVTLPTLYRALGRAWLRKRGAPNELSPDEIARRLRLQAPAGNKPTVERLRELRQNPEHNSVTLAAMFDVKPSTVRHWCRDAGVPFAPQVRRPLQMTATDEVEFVRMHNACATLAQLAARFGFSEPTAARHVERLGLVPHPSGRVPRIPRTQEPAA